MTRIDLTALRTLAEDASPGPWELIGGGEYVTGVGLMVGTGGEGVTSANAEFIAAANPATVLRLLDALEAVLAACDDPNTGPPGDPWTYGYEAALEDIRETITTALGLGEEGEA